MSSAIMKDLYSKENVCNVKQQKMHGDDMPL